METSHKRTYEKRAGIAYAASFVISTLHDFYSKDGVFNQTSSFWFKTLQIALPHAFVFGHAYFVWKGKVWAKGAMILFLVYGAFTDIDGLGRPVLLETGAVTIAHTLFKWTENAVIVALLILSFRHNKLYHLE